MNLSKSCAAPVVTEMSVAAGNRCKCCFHVAACLFQGKTVAQATVTLTVVCLWPASAGPAL